MKEKITNACLVGLILLLIYGCESTTFGVKRKSLAEDPGSPEKISILRDRASQYWALMVKRDLKEAYKYYDPFLRSKMSPEAFVEKHSAVHYQEASVVDVKVEGNIGTVKVKVKYMVPKVKVRQREFEVPPTTTEFEERWLFIYDNWYKEYYLKYFEAGIAYY